MTQPQMTTFTPEQIAEIEAMITHRIVIFHDALIERDQISPPSAASQMAFSVPTPKPELTVIRNDE